MRVPPTDGDPHGSPRGPFRGVVDTLAVATALLVLLKVFAVELYRVPSTSMQPSLIGHPAAALDRVLVDKMRYRAVDPARWDVVVFRYPLQRRHHFVKRIVGMPGERIRIAGGNLYRVIGEDPLRADSLVPLRRPDAIQERQWRSLHPARHQLDGGGPVLGRTFTAERGEWSEDEHTGTLTFHGGRDETGVLSYTDGFGGLVDRVSDGHPPHLARAMLGESIDLESVQDARVSMTLRAENALTDFRIELAVHRSDGRVFRFSLVAEQGVARLEARSAEDTPRRSEPFRFDVHPEPGRHLAFAHIDDRCVAWVDGEQVATLDTGAYRTLVPLRATGVGDEGRATLRLSARARGALAIAALRIDRDIHYTLSSFPGVVGDAVFTVPPGHYFVLGDNPRQSLDSRDWTALRVRVGPDGTPRPLGTGTDAIVTGDLHTDPNPDARLPDQNPLAVDDRSVLFVDEFGVTHTLRNAQLELLPVPDRGPNHAWFTTASGRFEAARTAEPFVPRGDILGRAVLLLWPWQRLGAVR